MARKVVLYTLAVAVTVYCTGVLYHVQESHNLGIQCLFSDPESAAEEDSPLQPRIGWVEADLDVVGARPAVGDRVRRVGGEAVPTFLHFQRRVDAISSQRQSSTTDERVDPTEDLTPVEQQIELLGRLTQADCPGTLQFGDSTWVLVDFAHPAVDGSLEARRAWLRLKPVPNRFLVLSLAWFLLEMIVLAIGAVVLVKRPRDRSARVFVGLSAASIVAFMGAFHWADLVGTRLLIYPFAACAILLPSLALHFYCLYPRPWLVLRRWPWPTLIGIYAVPAVSIVVALAVLVGANRAYASGAPGVEVIRWLDGLRAVIYGYLTVGVVMFAIGQGLLIHAFVHSRTGSQRRQVAGVMVAVALAAFMVVYLLFTAMTDRAEFAFGTTTRLVLYLSSILFTLAYAVSITRYKLFELGELVDRRVFYVAVSLAATAIFSLLVGIATAVLGKYAFRLEDALAAGLTAMLVVVVLGWVRSQLQQAVDRRFARQRDQLDSAMRRLGEAVDELVSPAQVAQAWLGSARDAVGARRGLVYLRQRGDEPFLLAAAADWPGAAEFIDADNPLVAELARRSVFDCPEGRGLPSAAQMELRDAEADVCFGLESDGELLGIGLLGGKPGAGYTRGEMNSLAALARTTALALRSADAQQTIEDLKGKLEAQVNRIAEQQQRIHFLQSELLADGQETSSKKPKADVPLSPVENREIETSLRGSGPAMRRMLDEAAKFAHSGASVLIRGESGTGKELLARTIHVNSPRAKEAFVPVHCAALSPSLLESELFGHVKGAFTGADQNRRGRFEKANGGTLFLDEVGDISPETQIKLLRVLQERAFEPVGSVETIQVDVRLIAATHRDLESMMRQGRFREDLYYRLNVVSIVCPPLRERRDDVFELALHFLRTSAQQNGKPIVRIADDAVEALLAYDWPGNVRELENAIQRAVILAEGEALELENLPPEITDATRALASRRRAPRRETVGATVAADAKPFEADLMDLQRERLVAALAEAGGNKSQAARRLGIPRSTLFSKLRRLGID